MSPSGQAYHDKMMRLGDMRSGKEAQEYYDLAKTATRNQQISNRINYGLGIAGLDTTPWEGHESYKDGSRFDRERFNEALRGIGESVIEGDGVASLVDDTENLIDYGRETFDIHPDEYPIIDRRVEFEEPGESEVIRTPHGPTFYDRGEGFEDDPNQPYAAPDDYVEEDFGDFYIDENTLAGPRFDDSGREDYIAASGMNPNLLRQEKLESIFPENFVPGGSPQGDIYATIPGISVDFEGDAPPPINYDYDPRTESGIANLMPGGALHDRIPWKQRLNERIREEMLKRGPHANEPRTSYYGSNWYDEQERKLENEREIAEGIRSPIDR